MIYLITLYIALNCLFSGYYFGEEYRWADTFKEKTKILITCVFLILFSIPFLTIMFIIVLSETGWRYINKYTQIQFFFSYFFTRKWENVSLERLENLNKANKNKDPKIYSDRLFMFCVKIINKRNNYEV